MKKEIYPTLTTPYLQEMDTECPWNEYPRPSLVRDSFFSLNGKWDFALTKENIIPHKVQIIVTVDSVLKRRNIDNTNKNIHTALFFF